MSTFMIQKNNCSYNMIDEYGSLTYDDIHTHALTYNGLNVRYAQNSIQIFNCLSGSLTEAGKSRVFLEARRYTINGFTDGLLFLKVTLQLAHIDTQATVTVIHTRLSMLDSKMVNLQDNVTDFNKYVKTQCVSLKARGETTLDLLVNLFKGYKAADDDRLVNYIEMKEDDYNEGLDISPDALMELVESKYKTLVKTGKWKEQSAADPKIVALTAQLNELKVKPNETPAAAAAKRPKDKKKGDKNTSDKWFLTPPKEGEPPKQQKGGKDWWWCPNHAKKGKWVHHDPKDCKQPKRSEVPPVVPLKDKKQKDLAKARLRVKTLAALLNLEASEGDYDF
jgi:hypothetical protein